MTFKLKEWIANVTANLADLRPMFIFKSYSYTYTNNLAANATFNVTANQFGVTVPTGYSLFGIRTAYSNQGGIAIDQFRLNLTANQFVRCRNLNTSAITSDIIVYVSIAFIKTPYRTTE